MTAIEFPGRSRRWKNESTNFYQALYSTPEVASQQKVYRCSQYKNPGHFLKVLGNPLYPLVPEPSINPFQSHQQKYQQFASPSFKHDRSPVALGRAMKGLVTLSSLRNGFYVTSYQSLIEKYAIERSQLNPSITQHSSSKTTQEARFKPIPGKIRIVPPTTHPFQSSTLKTSPTILRKRATSQNSISRGEMLKKAFAVFPAPMPHPVFKPSIGLKRENGKIPNLRAEN